MAMGENQGGLMQGPTAIERGLLDMIRLWLCVRDGTILIHQQRKQTSSYTWLHCRLWDRMSSTSFA